MKRKIIYFSISLLLQSIMVWGQGTENIYVNNSTQDSVMFVFRSGSDLLTKDYRNNYISFNKLNEVLTNDLIVSHIDSIVIFSSASPDGRIDYNMDLAKRRGFALKKYISLNYTNINIEKIHVNFSVTDWFEIKKLIYNDPHFPNKEQSLKAFSNDVPPATIEWRLKRINDGKVWSYLIRSHMWKYTAATSVFYYLDISDKPFTLNDNIEKVVTDIKNHVEKKRGAVIEPVDSGVTTNKESSDVTKKTFSYKIISTTEYEQKPLFALKTNLLFDALTILNIELEVPIGKRFSVAAECIFPWWVFENKQNALQLLSGNIEGRFWFNNRENRPLMTGWFAGLYGGGGMYDLECNKKGYQGEFYIAVGVSGGFAHTINKSGTLRMEYSLGIGYLNTDYRYYEAVYDPSHICNEGPHDWHLIHKNNGTFNWFGPTKAKVSLVWMLNRKAKKGGYIQ